MKLRRISRTESSPREHSGDSTHADLWRSVGGDERVVFVQFGDVLGAAMNLSVSVERNKSV